MSDDKNNSPTADSGSDAEQLRQAAAHLEARIGELAKSVQVSIANLKGEIRSVPLAQAEHQAPIRDEELRDAMQTIILDKRLQGHDQHALSQDRPEPETLREWFKALFTGRAAVALFSGMGVLSLRILQIGLIVSLVGFSVKSSDGIELIERAKTVELRLIDESHKAQLAGTPGPIPVPVPTKDELDTLADDATTIANLRTVFRTAAANALQDVATKNAASTRRSAFGMGAVDARRAILAQSERPAAPTFDPGADARHFRASAPSTSGASDVLDEAFLRRVNSLKSHEPTWRRLRLWAAHPVGADYAGEAFLRTTFGGLNDSALHAVRVWSEQASYEFADDLIRGVNPAAAAQKLATRAREMPTHASTARDKRLFADFKAGIPERVNAEFDPLAMGVKEPGSLRRTSSTSGAHVPSYYEDLFPTASSAPSGGPTPNRQAILQGHSASSRSYNRIRFSARVGGVVFGRQADPGGAAPDVVALLWQIHDGKGMMLTVRQRDGSAVRLGPYHPAVVHHALAFVADGRVVVVTLPSATQKVEMILRARRVVVHPAIEDTAFACNVIQIDRFVDTLTRSHSGVPDSPRYSRIESARNGVTAVGEILRNEGQPGDDSIDNLVYIQRHLSSCTKDDDCLPIKHYSEMQVDFGAVSEFLECLRDSDINTPKKACLSTFPVTRTARTFIVDSGVQERPYTVDRQFSFVSGAANADDMTWPIQFVIQAMPILSESDFEDALDTSLANKNPWQFPTISEDVQAAVTQGVETNKNAREVLKNVRDFLLLQRLFRTALNGELGESFPLDALVKLSSETKRYVQVRRNERWNIHDPFHFNPLREAILSRIKEGNIAALKGTTCKQRIADIVAAGDRKAEGYFDFWRLLGKLDTDCKYESFRANVADLVELQQLLRQHDIIAEVLAMEHSDWQKAPGPLYCPAL